MAFPLSAFGLSAFFFSSLSSLAFPDNTTDFLLLLAIGTFAMCFVSVFFIHVVPHSPPYSAIPTSEGRGRSRSNPMQRTKSEESRQIARQVSAEPGRQLTTSQDPASYHDAKKISTMRDETPEITNEDIDETSSLMSKSSSSNPGDIPYSESHDKVNATHHSHNLDIRGLALLPTIEFWQLFSLLGLLAGIGLMTIK